MQPYSCSGFTPVELYLDFVTSSYLISIESTN